MFKWLMLAAFIVMGAYILWRGIHWLKLVMPLFHHKISQGSLIGIYIILSSALFFGAFCPEGSFKRVTCAIGNVWLGFIILLLFFGLVADLIVLALKLIDRKKEVFLLRNKYGTFIIGISVIGLSAVLSIYGAIHANQVVTTSYEIEVEKSVEGIDQMKLVLVADMHLGYSVGCEQMEQMVERINEQNPDLVVFAGDIFNNNYDALDDSERLKQLFLSIQSTYGVYAVWGNHDVKETLVGGFSVSPKSEAFRDERMEQFILGCGMTLLMDDVTEFADGKIQLIGRLDEEKAGDGTDNRKELSELLANVDKEKPVFVINHEPTHLSDYAALGVDVMLSGHTHAGQFFPLTLTTPFAWENAWGIKKVDQMYSIVTSGVGFYGPALRIGTDAEVMAVTVKFGS